MRAKRDSAYAEFARAVGQTLEFLPESERRRFLERSAQRHDSLFAACRRRAAGPLSPPAYPIYEDCVAAAERQQADSLFRIYQVAGSVTAGHGGCLAYEPDTVALSGVLERRTYPGRPNYESVDRGDERETGFYLVVHPGLCVTRNLDEINQPTAGVQLVQLVLDQAGYEHLRPFLTKTVTLRGTLYHSHTGHHHAELLLQVANARRHRDLRSNER